MRTFHGGDIYSNAGVRLDFSVNTNPLGMPHFVSDAARESIDRCSSYPDVNYTKLKAELAAVYGIDKRDIIVGNGAADIIFSAVRALNPKRGIVISPAFGEYEAALEAAGAERSYFDTKEEDGFRTRTDEFLQWIKVNAVTSKISHEDGNTDTVLFLCNPNNPTGTVLGAGELTYILDFCEENNIFVIVDECFLEFCDPGRTLSAAERVREHSKNLLVLSAATKTYAMAGLRLGYGFCANRGLTDKIDDVRQPWSVSIPALAAGESLFAPQNEKKREEYLTDSRALIKREREYLKCSLEKIGFAVFDPEADFIFFKDDSDGQGGRLYNALLEQGILIRNCGSYRGLDGSYYRAAVKDHRANMILAGELERYAADRCQPQCMENT